MTIALDRGIKILKELGNAQGLTLSEITKRTGIPKSTTHRLLKSLCGQNLVRQNRLDQRYRSNVLLPQQSEIHIPPADQPLLEIACKYAESLTSQVLWPSDIFIPIGDELFFIESTRALTRVYIPHCRIQTKINIINSAAGRVLLAYSDDQTADKYLQQTWLEKTSSEIEKKQFLETWPTLRSKIRQQGFAFRAPTYFGKPGAGDGLRAIAVPILNGNKVRACINLVWPSLYASEDAFAKNYAKLLIQTANEISSCLKD